MSQAKINIDSIIAQTEEQLAKMTEDGVGDPDKLRAVNIARHIQLPAMILFYQELNAGTPASLIAQNIAGSLGNTLGQLLNVIEPDERDGAFEDLVEIVYDEGLSALERSAAGQFTAEDDDALVKVSLVRHIGKNNLN